MNAHVIAARGADVLASRNNASRTPILLSLIDGTGQHYGAELTTEQVRELAAALVELAGAA